MKIASSDDWPNEGNVNAVVAVAARIGAFPIEASDRTSAPLLTLQSGVYSFVASGKAGATVIVLVEVYDAD